MIAGLVYGWVVQPPVSQETNPAALQSSFKDAHRLLIAQAYEASGDVVRARARLELLGDENARLALEQQAQKILASNGSEAEARALANLAAILSMELGSTK